MKKSLYKYFFVAITILLVFFVINHLYGRYILYEVINNKRNQSVDLEVFNVNKNLEGIPINLFYSNFILPTNSNPKFKLWKDCSATYFDEYELIIPKPLKVEPINRILLEKSIPNMTNWFTNELLLAELDKNTNYDEKMMNCFDSYEMSVFCLKLKPKTLFEFNLLTKSKLDIYVFELTFKSMVCIRKNKAILETADFNSIIKYDSKKNDGRVEANIWSKNGKIHPNFFLNSNSTEKSLSMMINILSSLKFNLDELPNNEVFEEKLVEAIQKYELKDPSIENKSK